MHRTAAVFFPPNSVLRRAVALACLALVAGGAHAAGAVKPKAWDGGNTAPSVDTGGSLDVTGYTANANSWSDNTTRLSNGAWAHSGGSPWFVFNLLSAADVTLTVANATAGKNWTPGMTVWASGASLFDGGTGDATDVGALTGTNSPHSFNQVGQIGSAGTLWMSGANGNMLETLAYANSGVDHSDASQNDWGVPIHYGVHDVSIDNLYESGVSGSVASGFAQLKFTKLQAGWYTVFVGGACTACGSSTFNMALDVATAPVPEPETYAMLLAGLGLVGFAARRRIRHQG